MSDIHGVTWSQEVEVQFYCLAPVLAFIFMIRAPWLRRCSILVVMACAGMQVQDLTFYSRAGLSILNWFQFFLAGFLLADIYVTDWPRVRSSWLWDVASIPCWIATFMVPRDLAHVTIPFLCLVMYTGAFKGVWLPRFFRSGWVATIGGMCYSLYLTHTAALSVLNGAFIKLHWTAPEHRYLWLALMYIFGLPTVLVIGTAYFKLIEQPCMRRDWPQRLWARMRGRPVLTTA